MKLKTKLENLLHKYDFSPQKRLSQNFLIDPKIISRIVEEIQLKEDDLVLEIGAGTGILTSKLVEKARKVWAIEIDEKLCQMLKDEVSEKKNLEVICADITKCKIENYIQADQKIKVVGNLPYHIASFLILNLVKKEWMEVGIFTIQREVAEKLLCPPGDKKRGALTVLISYYANIQRVIDVPPHAFYPSPKVSSSVVRITKKKERPAKDEELFTATVKAGFSEKRKILLNSLSRGLGIPREFVREILAKSGVSEKKRAEALTVEDFVKISNLLWEKKIAR